MAIPKVDSIGTPEVSCRFADVHAKTRKIRAEVGQNIITVDSALFKFTVAKISNSDFTQNDQAYAISGGEQL